MLLNLKTGADLCDLKSMPPSMVPQ
jgi:hypothetical protein